MEFGEGRIIEVSILMPQLDFEFDVSVTTDKATGRVMAAYLKVRGGKVAKTVELEEGTALADYDSRGRLLGVELLAPCRLAVMERVMKKETAARRELIRQFFRSASPRQLVLA